MSTVHERAQTGADMDACAQAGSNSMQLAEYSAHFNKKTGAEQTVREHSVNVAEHMARVLEPLGLSCVSRAIGLLHDLGKLKLEFYNYIHSKTPVARGTVVHTFQAVRYIWERYHDDENSTRYILAEIFSAVTGSHHGLFDCVKPDGESGFAYRVTRDGIGYDEVLSNFPLEDRKRFADLFDQAVAEMDVVLDKILALAAERGPDVSDAFYDGEVAFYVGLLTLVILSALIDADRRDTAAFMSDTKYPDWLSKDEVQDMWRVCLENIESGLAKLPRETEIDKARGAISDACRAAASEEPGVFILHVNTGGGKTLSGLRFAVAHAMHYNMRHVIFTEPRLTILDQNADVMRKYIQDEKLVLECHSNVTNLSGRSWAEHAVLSEGWDAPVIITTAVQFFMNLFSGEPEYQRRLHAMCDSVIVIDEVQTIPDNQLTLFCMAVNFLTNICHTSVVLCSATQPNLWEIKHSILSREKLSIRRIKTPCDEYDEVFRRADITYRPDVNNFEKIADLAKQIADDMGSSLVVCNTQREARTLYNQLKGVDAELYHLSGNMQPDHRRDTLAPMFVSLNRQWKRMKERMLRAWKKQNQKVLDRMATSVAENKRVICIATSVIEAGVDISFGGAIRLLAGLDSVIQTLGRVFRNGELGPDIRGMLYVVPCQEEDLRYLPEIKRGQDAMLALLAEYQAHPEAFRHRLDSDEAIRYYYSMLYKDCEELHDYPLGNGLGSEYELLSLNRKAGGQTGMQYMRQAFRTAGEHYSVFGEDMVDVITDYGRGKRIIEELSRPDAMDNPGHVKALLREAANATVSVPRAQLDRHRQDVIELPGGALALIGHYDKTFGVVFD